jgi:hypothetical protein
MEPVAASRIVGLRLRLGEGMLQEDFIAHPR